MSGKAYHIANRERDNARARERMAWYKAHGICQRCGQRDVVPGLTMCGGCLYRDQMAYDKTDKSARLENQRAWRARHIADGLCEKCNRPAAPGRQMCDYHRTYRRVRNARLYVHRPRDPALCTMCDSPHMDGKKVCAEHYAKLCAQLDREREKIDRENHIWRRT